ncbi:hypothetical protein [Dasineura jujubifolia toursvirus 2a]|nr:hypothetical protein [Dasineura jujubifolia toursvirus 2a]
MKNLIITLFVLGSIDLGLSNKNNTDILDAFVFQNVDPPEPSVSVNSNWVKISLIGKDGFNGTIVDKLNNNARSQYCGDEDDIIINEKPITFFVEKKGILTFWFEYAIGIESENKEDVAAIHISKYLLKNIEIRILSIPEDFCKLEQDPKDKLHYMFICSNI